MTRVPTWGLAAMALLLVVSPGRAQTRNELIQAGLAAYGVPEPQRALQLLVAGINPAAGPRDSLWGYAVQTLVQILHDARQDSLADLWARWAVRQTPRLALDTLAFTPEVTQRFVAARGQAADPPGLRVDTDWRWPAVTDLRARGSVRASGARGLPVQLIVVGRGTAQAGDSLALPAGSYQFQALAPGYLRAEVTREVLPGVETRLEFRLLPEANGLLSVGAEVAALVFVNGERIGYTPVVGLRVAAGSHTVRLQRQLTVVDTVISVPRDGRVHVGRRPAAPPRDGLERAVAAFDSADVAGGSEALRRELATVTAPDQRARLLAFLGAAHWWLGAPDSARARFREATETDPFLQPDLRRFSPELVAVYRAERRATSTLAARIAADTVVRPDSGRYRLAVGVGIPGPVRVRIAGSGRDTVLVLTPVDSIATFDLALRDSGGAPLAPGAYRLWVERMAEGLVATSRAFDLAVDVLPVDTTTHLAPLADSVFVPESRRGGLPGSVLLRGSLLAGLAVLAPLALRSADVEGGSVQRGAMVIGGGIAIASILGAVSGRPVVPVEEGMRHNRGLRDAWTARNAGIAATNQYLRRFAPLRLRVTPLP